MNGKVRATQRSVNKVLDYICTYDKARGGVVPVDEEFYNGLIGMDRTLINQTLNVLEDYQIIKKFPPGAFLGVPSLCLLTGAFSYKLKRKQEAVRYWIPIILSILSFIVSILSLIVAVIAITVQYGKEISQTAELVSRII